MGTEPVVAVLGDVVGSKRHGDAGTLRSRLKDHMEKVNGLIEADQPLLMTIGDEFQGLYGGIDVALEATLLLRLSLVGRVDVRFGIGLGPLDVRDPADEPFGQDGPAWWAAREAIESVATEMTRRASPRGLRTGFVEWGDGAASETTMRSALVNAVLVTRDEIVGQMDDRAARLAFAYLTDRNIKETAAEEGISASAVYDRLQRSGTYAVAAAVRSLREVAA